MCVCETDRQTDREDSGVLTNSIRRGAIVAGRGGEKIHLSLSFFLALTSRPKDPVFELAPGTRINKVGQVFSLSNCEKEERKKDERSHSQAHAV